MLYPAKGFPALMVSQFALRKCRTANKMQDSFPEIDYLDRFF